MIARISMLFQTLDQARSQQDLLTSQSYILQCQDVCLSSCHFFPIFSSKHRTAIKSLSLSLSHFFLKSFSSTTPSVMKQKRSRYENWLWSKYKINNIDSMPHLKKKDFLSLLILFCQSWADTCKRIDEASEQKFTNMLKMSTQWTLTRIRQSFK